MALLPVAPRSFARIDLEVAGFRGWLTWHALRTSDFGAVTGGPAAYVVYRTDDAAPLFLRANPGGRFKGKDPSAPPPALNGNWVAGAHVVYIGKADIADRRLRQFARFGDGEPVGHWGGRYIWQLADSAELLVAWHAIFWAEHARDYERRLLARFSELFGGRRPFANLTG